MTAPAGPAEAPRPPPLRLGQMIDSLVTGGAERLLVTFAEGARDRPEIDLTVFVLSDRRTEFRAQLDAAGITVVALPGRSLADPRRFLALVRALRAHRIEYLHAHLISSTCLGGLAARLLGLPFAATIHNVRASTRRVSRIRRWLYRLALRRPATTRIAVGRAVAEAAAEDAGPRARFFVVANAVSPAAVAPARSRDATRRSLALGDALAMIAVGAVIGQKAYEDLLEAVARVVAWRPSVVLLIAGHAPEPDRLAALQERARDLGIAGHVRFLGLRRDIPDIVAASDVFVSASHWEGAPVSLLEAMATGTACVVTDVGDNRRVLRGTGCAPVPPGDPSALAEALIAVLDDEETRRRLASAVRARVLAEYDVPGWVDRLLAVYAETARRADWHVAAPCAADDDTDRPRLEHFPA